MAYRRARSLTLVVAAVTALAVLVPLPELAADTPVDVPTSAVKLTTNLVRATDCPGTAPPTSCGPIALGVVGDTLFFKADDGVHGTELWVSDGTSAGTKMVKDINPGITSSMPVFGGEPGSSSHPAVIGSTLIFEADDGVHGRELWKSDGTDTGTELVKDLNTIDLGGGVNAGSFPLSMTTVGSVVFFSAAADDVGYYELWKSDGTAAGTVLVKDIDPVGASNPGDLTNVGGTLFFRADDGTTGRELWKSDGTAAGTILVKDIRTGAEDSTPSSLTTAASTLFFKADDGTHGVELWKSDGTTAGTVLVEDVQVGTASLDPEYLTAVGSMLFFAGRQLEPGDPGIELWKSDGTVAGTTLVKDIYPGTSSSQPQSLRAANPSTLLFHAADGAHREELWKSDGTEAGTVMVKDIYPGGEGSEASFPGWFTPFDGLVFFTADDGVHGVELWKTDLTTVGTVLAVDGVTGPEASAPQELTVVGDKLLFTADDGTARQLWLLNRAPEGTTPAATTPEDTAVAITLTATDADGDSFALATASTPAHGGLTGAVPNLTYTPGPGFYGFDSFDYTATDTNGAIGTATVNITVTAVDEVIYVDQSATTGANNGMSWDDAFVELQSALAVAGSGDEVRVAQGTYLPDFDPFGGTHSGDTTRSFVVQSGVMIVGGYPSGGIGLRDPSTNATILSGDLGGDDGPDHTNISDNALTVIDVSSTSAETLVSGVVVTAAFEQGIYGTGAGLTIADSAIDDNHGRGARMVGGTFLLESTSVARNNGVYDGTDPGNNLYVAGGGMYLSSTVDGRLSNVTVADNRGGNGGGIFAGSNLTIVSSEFRGNSGCYICNIGWNGGAVTLDHGTIVNSTFVGNRAYRGSAIRAKAGDVVVINSTFVGNDANGGGTFETNSTGTGSIAVHNSIVWDNLDGGVFVGGAPTTVTYSVVEGGFGGGTAIVDADPRFTDADGPDDVYGTSDDDVSLLGTSPAIDAGDNSAVPPDSLDLDGDADTAEPTPLDLARAARFVDHANSDGGAGTPPIVDMGAFEEPFRAPGILYVDQSATGTNDGLTWANAFVDLQDALAAAFSGDSIQVAEGTYRPSASDQSAAFKTVHEVDMEGSYPAGGGGPADFASHPTILSGDLEGDDVPGDLNTIDDNSVTVLDVSNTHMRFDNFGITAATGAGVGGADSDVLIGFGLIDGNHGRGVHLTGTTGVFIAGPTISNNSAGTGPGGGVYLEGTAAARFSDVIIEGNSAASGAGVFVEGTVTMYNTAFRGNTDVGATSDGGGLKLAGVGDSVLMNTTFVGNQANVGSALVVDGGTVSVVNSTFTGNTASDSGGTLIQLDSGSLAVDNSIVWGNVGSNAITGATASYSLVEGGYPPGIAILDTDPLFVDADGLDDVYGTPDDNVRLLGISPAIDAGDNTAVPPDTLGLDNDTDTTEPTPHDLDHRDRFFDRGNDDSGVLGDPLVFDGVVDMGAFELGNEAPIAQPDSYTTNEDVPLVVVAPGVLLNDGDDDGDTIVAQSAGGELHGTVSLAADGSFTFTPEPDYHTPPGDDAQFQYQAVDPTGGLSGVETVTIYVNDVNDEPSFTMGDDVVQLEVGTGPDFRGGWATNISAGPPNESAQVLTFTLTPDDPSLFLVPPAISPSTGNMTYTVVPDANGSTQVTVVLKDDGGVEDGGDDTSPSSTFNFMIVPVNDEPFLAGNDINVPEGSSAHSFSGWATGIKTGPPNESAQTLSVDLDPAAPSLFSVQPELDLTNGDLTFTLAPGATGSTLVTITLTDDGGTANGGDDTFVDTFTIAITPDDGGDGPPGADDWSFDMDEAGTISGSVLGPGDGGGGCVVTVDLVTDVAHGTLTLDSDGSFTYLHDGSSATTDTFEYQVSCGGEVSRVATVTINISLLSYSVGLVNPASGEWRLRSSFTEDVTSFYFGNPGDIPFMGDWNCDGIDTPGLFRLSDAYAYLSNANRSQNADIRFFFGDPGDVPLPGDFNGDGCDTLSLYRPSTQTFFVMNALGENEGGLGAADYFFVFGNPGDKPVVGDWDGDGITEIGLHRESTGFFYWRNTLTQGIADGQIFFGDPGDRFVAGDFGVINGVDTPAVFRPSNTTFYFRHSLSEGNADSQFIWGEAAWMPVAGVTR